MTTFKSVGMIRAFDNMGRIVIPNEIRKIICGTEKTEGIKAEIFYDDKEGTILLKPLQEIKVWKPTFNSKNQLNGYICPYCGTKYKVIYKYCPTCGHEVSTKDLWETVDRMIAEINGEGDIF